MTFFYMSSRCCYWPGSASFLRGEASNGFGKANMNKILRTSRRTWTFVVCRRWDPSERDAFESQSEKRNWNLQTWFANVSKVWLEQLLVRSSKVFFRCGKLGFLGGTVSCVSVLSYIFREFQAATAKVAGLIHFMCCGWHYCAMPPCRNNDELDLMLRHG